MCADETVYIVDDDDAICRALRELLASVGIDSKVFSDCRSFLEAYDASRPGCLVLDLHLPDASGASLQQGLAARGMCIPVILMTAFGDTLTAVQAMKRGAVDFLEKPVRPGELVASIREALNRDRQRRLEASRRAHVTERLKSLTPRETQILEMLAKGRPPKAIATELRRSYKTIDKHKTRVMQKLGVHNMVDLVRMAIRARIVEP